MASYDAAWGKTMMDKYGVSAADLEDPETQRYLNRKSAADRASASAPAPSAPAQAAALAPTASTPAAAPAPAATPAPATPATAAEPKPLESQMQGIYPGNPAMPRSSWQRATMPQPQWGRAWGTPTGGGTGTLPQPPWMTYGGQSGWNPRG